MRRSLGWLFWRALTSECFGGMNAGGLGLKPGTLDPRLREDDILKSTLIKVGIHHTKVLAPGLVGRDAVVRHPDAKPPWMGLWRTGCECFGGMNAGGLGLKPGTLDPRLREDDII